MDRPRPSGSTEASLRLSLLDNQLIDADELPVGRIDDLELSADAHGVAVTALLVAQRHLGPRLGGLTGGLMTWTGHQLEDDGSGRIDVREVDSWPDMPRLRQRLADLPVAGLEKWLATRVVRHLPGADDAGL